MRATFESEYVAHVFEQSCINYLWRLADRNEIPFVPQRIGPWWTKDQEIDIVALNQNSRDILFGECKWTQRPIGIDVLKALYHKARQVKWHNSDRCEWFILFSRAGYQDALLERASHPNEEGRLDVILVHNGQVMVGGP